LQEVFYRQVGTCSKGFRQRVGLAQALINDPPVLLLDEPTNGLDPLQVHEMRNLISGLGSEKTVIITSHVLSEIEAVADRVVMMNNGLKVADKDIASMVAEQLVAVRLRCDENQLREICLQAGVSSEQLLEISSNGPFSQALVQASENTDLIIAGLAKQSCAAGVDVSMLNPQGNSLEHEFRVVCQPRGSA
jgi:ABC-2 type transport system ATP-binding protein